MMTQKYKRWGHKSLPKYYDFYIVAFCVPPVADLPPQTTPGWLERRARPGPGQPCSRSSGAPVRWYRTTGGQGSLAFSLAYPNQLSPIPTSPPSLKLSPPPSPYPIISLSLLAECIPDA